MGKQVYTINGNMYIINDETGKIGRIVVEENVPISQNDLDELIKLLANLAKRNGKEED